MTTRVCMALCGVSLLAWLVACHDTESGAPAAATGGNRSAVGQNCGLCADVECRPEMLACAKDGVCDAVLQCCDSCTAADRPCRGACARSTPRGDDDQTFKNLIGCVAAKCETDCGF